MRVILIGTIFLSAATLSAQPRIHPEAAANQIDRAMAQLASADDALAAMQAMLEKDAAVLAKLREAREALEEESQPMTAVNAMALRLSEVSQLRPHEAVRHELIPVGSMLEDFRRSSANIDLGKLSRQLDTATNVASDIVVNDIRMMQPILTSLTRMQEALQTRVSAFVASQGRAMEMTARRSNRR